MLWIGAQDRIRFGGGKASIPGDLSDPAQVVSAIDVQVAEHFIRPNRHRRKKLNAVALPGLAQAHQPVVEPHRALSRRELADVGRSGARRQQGGNVCRRGPSGGVEAVGPDTLAGNECNEGQQRDGSDDPG